jgi:hypothetical protein
LPSDSGISEIRFSSMTCPADADARSSSGDSARTETVSSSWPTSRLKSSVSRSAILTSTPSRTTFLNPDSSTATV